MKLGGSDSTVTQNRYLKIRKRKKNTQTGDHALIHKEKMRGRLIDSPKANPVFRTRDYQFVFWFVILRSTNSVMSAKVGNELRID